MFESIRCLVLILVALGCLRIFTGSAVAGEAKRPELILPLGHENALQSMMLSWDGKQLLTGADVNTAILWDIETGKPLRIFKGQEIGPFRSVSLSEGGKRVLTGGYRTAILWDGQSGKRLRTINVEERGNTVLVALSRDGKRYLTGSWEKSMILWDAETGNSIQILKDQETHLSSIALSADGKRVLAGYFSGLVVLWDGDTGKRLQTFKSTDKIGVKCMALSPNGKRLVAGLSDKSAMLWDVDTGKPLQTFKDHDVTSVAVSRDGKRVMTGSFTEGAILWDSETGQQLQKVNGHTSYIIAVALSAEGDRAFTASLDHTAILWHCATGKRLHTFRPLTHSIDHMAVSEDGKKALTGNNGGALILWDLESAKPRATFKGHSGYLTSVALSRDGMKAITGSGDKTAILWDSESGKALRVFKGHAHYVGSAALSSDGKRVVTGGSSADKVAILWDCESAKQLQTFKVETESGYGIRVALSGDGERVFTGSKIAPPTLWDSKTGKALRVLKEIPGDGLSLILSDDGKRALTKSWSQVSLWDTDDGKQLRTFFGSGILTAMALSKDSKQVSIYTYDNSATIWDSESGKKRNDFRVPNLGLGTITLGPKHEFLLRNGSDGTVRIWKTGSEKELFGFLSVGEEWLFWTPEGYYTCSPNGENLIAWKITDDSPQGYRIVGPEQFRKQFHRPDMFRHLLRELDLGKALAKADAESGRNPTATSNIADALPPYVIIAQPFKSGDIIKTEECQIVAKAKSVGDNHVASLQLLIDGRPYDGGRRKFTIVQPKAGETTASWKANLIPGKNRVQIVAESVKGSTSHSEEIEIIREDEPEALPKLLVLSVGVSAYTKADRRGVEYAGADAKRFIDVHLTHGKALYKDPEPIPLTTGDASKVDILDAFELLSKKARRAKNPVTLIFLAGHGKVNEVGDFYFLAADSDPKKLRATAISGAELKDALKNIPGKVIVFLDACHSGAFAGDTFRNTGLTDDLFRDLTSSECGVVMICSSRGKELSQQSNSQKAGLFTLALEEGLSGKATRDKNGAIYLPDLFAYVNRRVRELSDDQQHPYSSELNKIGNLPLTRP